MKTWELMISHECEYTLEICEISIQCTKWHNSKILEIIQCLEHWHVHVWYWLTDVGVHIERSSRTEEKNDRMDIY